MIIKNSIINHSNGLLIMFGGKSIKVNNKKIVNEVYIILTKCFLMSLTPDNINLVMNFSDVRIKKINKVYICQTNGPIQYNT